MKIKTETLNQASLSFNMSKLYFSFSFIFLLCCLQSKWEYFTSEKGKFTILAPGKFTEKSNTIPTAIGETEYHTFLYQSEDENADNLVYMVSYCDYPEGSIHSDSTELVKEFFEITVESALKSVKGELFYSAAINLGDYPGMLWRVNYQDGEASIKTKAFLVKNRYYAVQTITFKEKSLNPKIDDFLDSFSVIE